MPVKGRQSKRTSGQKSAPNDPASKIPGIKIKKEELSLKISEAGENWEDTVGVLCDSLQIPSMSSRKDLKRIHGDFDRFYSRLDAVYQMFAQENNEMVMGGVVGIFAKMCTDSVICNELLKKGMHDLVTDGATIHFSLPLLQDVLSKVIPLIDNDTCRVRLPTTRISFLHRRCNLVLSVTVTTCHDPTRRA
jgi:hypothetical protein